ncbi:MAG: creatininase family protein [Planctomycetes bacterium]|nr:creatininase family protein [Planctomycetota bacterium]
MAQWLAQLPYTTLEAALASGKPVVAILPVGATESHGPHLPLNTDVVISEAFAELAADRLEADGGVVPFILPSLAYTPAGYASPFTGTISLGWEVAKQTLMEIGANLKRQGFASLAIANSHFDPANVNILRQASDELEAQGLPVAFADATRRKLAAQLSEEFQSGDCHGGQFETSIVLAAKPELVDQALLKGLPAREVGLINAIQSQGSDANFQSVGMDASYCGNPAGASASEGMTSISTLADALVQAIVAKVLSTES